MARKNASVAATATGSASSPSAGGGFDDGAAQWTVSKPSLRYRT